MNEQLSFFHEAQEVVCIEWLDAVSEDAWASTDEILPETSPIKTVGMFIKENESVVTVGLNYDMANDNWSCIMHIPKGMISKITKIG